MTFLYSPPVSDPTSLAHRLQVSQPVTLFDSCFKYGVEENLFSTATTGAGTATFNGSQAAWILNVGTAAGDSVYRQTFRYFKYQAGKPMQIMLSAVFQPKTGVTAEVGIADQSDGALFRQQDLVTSVVLRSSVTGTAVEIVIPQAQWNLDVLDGSRSVSNPSGIALDITQAQLFVIEYLWYGVGPVRYGLMLGGKIVWVHQMINDNVRKTVYMQSGCLPLSFKITNTAATASSTTLVQICSSVASEAFNDDFALRPFSTDTGNTNINVKNGQLIPIITLSNPLTFNGLTNRSEAYIQTVNLLDTSGANIQYKIFQNATVNATAWTQIDPASFCQVNTDATTISGGTCRYTDFTSGASKYTSASTFELLLYPGSSFTIAAAGAGANGSCRAALNWSEIY